MANAAKSRMPWELRVVRMFRTLAKPMPSRRGGVGCCVPREAGMGQ
jgi:hypothetical protein